MGIINPIIDTESIGKHIGKELYSISSQKGVTQTDIANKMKVSTPSVSVLLTGKKTTTNLDQYWRIAEAIPISRSEFDKIVEGAKRKVIGDIGINNDPDIAYATLARNYSVSPEDVKKAMEMYKLYKN